MFGSVDLVSEESCSSAIGVVDCFVGSESGGGSEESRVSRDSVPELKEFRRAIIQAMSELLDAIKAVSAFSVLSPAVSLRRRAVSSASRSLRRRPSDEFQLWNWDICL